MSNIRRWYVYLITIIALLAILIASTDILRFLLIPGEYFTSKELANNIAVILVGSPIYLIHWIWAQHSAKEAEEKQSFTRTLYLYLIIAIMTGFLVNNSFGLMRSLLHIILNITPSSWSYFLSPQKYMYYYLIPIIIFSCVWFYHWRITRKESKNIPGNPYSSIFQQLYNYLSAGTGLVMSTLAIFILLRWILEKLIFPRIYFSQSYILISSEIARIIIGIPLWILFWNSAQNIFLTQGKKERESIIRKIYLYLVLFVSIIILITSAALVLVDIFEGWLGLPSSEEPSAILLPISIFLSIGLVWSYHTSVLKKDALLEEEFEQQANVRRIFTYLMAGVGLAAMLIGLGGIVSVLIRYLDQGSLIKDLREQLSWFTSSLIAGTPLWFIYWRNAQKNAEQPKIAGYLERRSFIRIYYLYFFIFIAMLTILSSLVFIVTQLVQILLDLRTQVGLITDIGQSISYAFIALGLVLYHRSILRSDRKQIEIVEADEEKLLNIILFDFGNGEIGKLLIDKLQNIKGVSITPIALSESACKFMGIKLDRKTYKNEIAKADVIIGRATPFNQQVTANDRAKAIMKSISSSSVNKLLIPAKEEGYEWLATDLPDEKKILSEFSNIIRQLKAEGKIKSSRRLTPLAILLIVVVTLCLLASLLPFVFVYL